MIYACGENQESVVLDIERVMKIAKDLYQDEEIVVNAEKSQLLFLYLKDDLKLCLDMHGNVVLR